MNKYVLTFVISLITSIIITSLLYSAGVSQKFIVIIAGASFVINGLVFWLALEYVVIRDASQIKDTLSYYLRGIKTEDLPEAEFNLDVTRKIDRDLRVLQKRKDKEILELHNRANFRSQFIADISHELKTPIFAAQGYVHTLLDGAVDDEEVRYKFLKKSANSLDFLDKLVKDLLELSQIETGNIVLMNDHFDLVKLVDEVIDDFEQQASAVDVTIKRSKKPSISIVFADFIRIRQVIQNLISNGIKYNKVGGRVRIKIIDKDDCVEVQMADTGVGIPKEDLDQVFKRFYRVDKSRTKIKNRASNGLGLAIVKHLLGAHNSTVSVKSKIGKGSVFSFSLQKDKPPLHGQRTKIEELDII
ncbi:MAG: cell wall metabolism sensor histidine kinase WalK [Cyclobacteriaceae bacterium]|nr:cell wall metabolism sensor histidine kinase WalK [Cyclobacteriaceae bacterium]